MWLWWCPWVKMGITSPRFSKPLTCHLERTSGGKKSVKGGLGSEAGAGNSDEISKGVLAATILIKESKRNESHRKSPWEQTIPDGSLSFGFSTRRNPHSPAETPPFPHTWKLCESVTSRSLLCPSWQKINPVQTRTRQGLLKYDGQNWLEITSYVCNWVEQS